MADSTAALAGEPSGALPPELLALMEHEKPIEDATAKHTDVVWALARIHEDELWRAAGYESFLAYLTGRWGA